MYSLLRRQDSSTIFNGAIKQQCRCYNVNDGAKASIKVHASNYGRPDSSRVGSSANDQLLFLRKSAVYI